MRVILKECVPINVLLFQLERNNLPVGAHPAPTEEKIPLQMHRKKTNLVVLPTKN